MNFRKKIRNEDGFTLTEVMIGMTILTVAIVAATQLVIGLMQSNSNNVKTLQAYYLSQEGIELVRNARDTNWIHNVDWLSGLDDGEQFNINLKNPFPSGIALDDADQQAIINQFAPWEITISEDSHQVVMLNDDDSQTEFVRHIIIEDAPVCEDDFSVGDECDYKLVTSIVTWEDGSKERDFYLQTILTNWKDGVF